jgi:hypothetical protein
MYKTKLNKCLNKCSSLSSLSLSISKDKSFLEILDSVQETKDDEIKTEYNDKNKKCKICSKYVVTNFDTHQTSCFLKKIKALEEKIIYLEITMKLKEEQIKHDIHIKGLELLIERNNEKWNKLME